MTTIETPRSIAQDGGWRVYTAATLVQLLDPYRHHSVTGRSGPDVYVLPPAAVPTATTMLGRGLHRGALVWVHNRNVGGHAVTVRNSSSSFTSSVAANTSAAFVLLDNSTEAGVWASAEASAANGRGATQPTGSLIDIAIERNQNNVNLLQLAIDEGYDGTAAALVRVSVAPNVVLGSIDAGTAALDVGGDSPISGINWFTGSLIVIRNRGVISGKGGDGGGGGIGGTGASAGQPGTDGGLALRAPVSVLVENLGVIQGGGGGGGGGDGQSAPGGVSGGGGGGGAGATVGANGAVAGGAAGFAATGAVAGTPGTMFLGGTGGAGSLSAGTVGGSAAIGGAPAATGLDGNTVNNSANSATGLRGQAGAAISRAASATVTFLATGTVTGATVVV